LHLERVLSRVRRCIPVNPLSFCKLVRQPGVDGHAPQWGLKCFGVGKSEAAKGNEVRRSKQNDSPQGGGPELRITVGSNDSRIDVPRVGNDERFGCPGIGADIDSGQKAVDIGG